MRREDRRLQQEVLLAVKAAAEAGAYAVAKRLLVDAKLNDVYCPACGMARTPRFFCAYAGKDIDGHDFRVCVTCYQQIAAEDARNRAAKGLL